MSKEKVIFLGTGTSQGVPMIGCDCGVCRSTDSRDKRLRSSVFIESRGVKFVIDTGPDFRYQMLRSGIREIDALLFTHSHKDHVAGLDDIRSFNHLMQRPVDIYAEKYTMEVIKREFNYAFEEERYPGTPELTEHVITTEPFEVKGVTVVPIRGLHYRMPVLGFRIGTVSYLTDMSRLEEGEIEKIKGSKILIIDALRRQKHISHFTLDEAIEIAAEVGAEQTYLTHISDKLGLYEELARELPQGVLPAYDGLTIETYE